MAIYSTSAQDVHLSELSLSFTALLGGALIELYGLRAVSLTGSALITIGLILSAFVTSVPLFFLTYSVIPGKLQFQ